MRTRWFKTALQNETDAPISGYVGLGSNLGSREALLRAAVVAIDRLPRTRVTGCSSFFQSRPMGPVSQPLFLNAVTRIRTRLSPIDLLEELQKIERRFGRVRKKQRWGPRTLDLDILVLDDIVVDQRNLVVPHPGIHARSFVLYPLMEIAPALRIPGRGTPASMLRNCPGPAPHRYHRQMPTIR